MQLLGLLKPDERTYPTGRFDLLQLDLVDLTSAGGRLLGLGSVGGKTTDKLLQLGDLGFLLGVIRQHALTGLGGSGHVFVVVAREQPKFAIIQVRHVGTHAVQEVAVVGNNDHGAVAGHQDIFQPADGIDIQVVGGLVQQQDIGVGEQCLGQQNPQFPAWCNSAHGAVVLFQGYIQAQQQFASAGIGGIAVHLGKLHLQVRHGHAVFLTHLCERVDAIPLGFYTPELFVAHNDRINHRAVLIGKLVLTQLTQPLVLVHHDLTG